MFLPLAPMALSTFDDGSDGSDTSDEWMMVESSDSDEDEDEGYAFSQPIPSAGSSTTAVAFDVVKYVTSWVWKAYRAAVMRAWLQ